MYRYRARASLARSQFSLSTKYLQAYWSFAVLPNHVIAFQNEMDHYISLLERTAVVPKQKLGMCGLYSCRIETSCAVGGSAERVRARARIVARRTRQAGNRKVGGLRLNSFPVALRLRRSKSAHNRSRVVWFYVLVELRSTSSAATRFSTLFRIAGATCDASCALP